MNTRSIRHLLGPVVLGFAGVVTPSTQRTASMGLAFVEIVVSDHGRAFDYELKANHLTLEDRGIHYNAGYLCTDCMALEDGLNAYDVCKDCVEGEAVPVWTAEP